MPARIRSNDQIACPTVTTNPIRGSLSLASIPLFAVCHVLLVSGCGANKASVQGDPKDAEKAAAKSQEVTADDVLTSAIHQLRPENYGINAAADKPINLLNSWRYKHLGKSGDADAKAAVNSPQGWIKEDELERLTQAKFDATDASHIRDAMLMRTISGFLSDRSSNEVERAGIIVDYVCRNVVLWGITEIELPVNPFWALQVGRGTAEDRAWLCAEILKQLRIDSVILRAKSDAKGTSDKWLFGVIVENRIHLFDTRLGLPVPSGIDEKAIIPATLSEIVSHPEWLEQLSANEPYPLTVADLKELDVYVISVSDGWGKRMHHLEQVLPTAEQCVIYDPPFDDGGQGGLLNRVASAGGWPVAGLKLWPYPKKQMDETRIATPEKQAEWQQLVIGFSLPIPVTYDSEGKPKVGSPEKKMQRFRMDQLLGKFTEATTKYLRIRHLEVEQNPPEIDRLNKMAAEDAFYWTGICKFELGDYETAVELLTDYVKKYDRKGKWFFAARSLLAQSHAKQGQLQPAITLMERSSSDDPCRAANAIRMKRWIALKAKQ